MNHSNTTKEIPRISIGMPVYNGEKYIREALDSLLCQTFSDFELIISDNCSIDATEDICRAYAARDSRIKYIRQIENKGALANFQFVLDEANCEYFMWAAYDDLWSPNFLSEAIILLSNEEVNFVFPSFELRSIELGFSKKFEYKIFSFVEEACRKFRVLEFCNTHYISLSVNIVYSIFETSFLRKAISIQSIQNEGALGAVILSLGRGAMNKGLFSKRYKRIWPGMIPTRLSSVYGWLKGRSNQSEVKQSIEAARIKMISLFPEYTNEINYIFDRYTIHKYDQYYKICPMNEVYMEIESN